MTTASTYTVNSRPQKPELDESFGGNGSNIATGLTNVAKALMYAADVIAAALERNAIPAVPYQPTYPPIQPYNPPPYQPYWTGPTNTGPTNTASMGEESTYKEPQSDG